MPSLEKNTKSGPAPSQPPAPAPPPRPPSLALAAAACLRHDGLRSAWCLAGFGDRAPWQKLWEAAFADGGEEEEEEGGGKGSKGRQGGDFGDADDAVDREPLAVRLASSLAARQKVQAEVCGPRCVGAGCLVAATEIDAALSRGYQRRQPLRAALAALLADVERREASDAGAPSLLLRHSPDASLPPAPSPRFVPLLSQVEAITEIDEALASGARLVALLSDGEAAGAGGGKTTAAAAAARAFLRRARRGAEDGEASNASGEISVSTLWDSAFWLDARGLEGCEDDGFSASSSSESPSSSAAAAANDDEDPSAAAFRALLAALGGSAVPGTPDRDRVLLRARSLFGDAADSSAGGGGGGGRAPSVRTAGLIVRVGERPQRGLLSALLELLDASAGLSVIAIGGIEDTSGLFAPEASVVQRPLSQAEARLFLRETAAAAEEEKTGSDCEEVELPPSLRDVRVLRAAAGLGIKAPRALLEDTLGGGTSVGESSSPRRALGSLLARRAPAPLLLRLSRLSSALLCGRGGTFTVFSASVVFNCDFEKALEYLRELQALGLARPAEAASASVAAVSAASSSSFSPSSASASWSLSSLAASVGQDLSERLGASPSSSWFSSLVVLARIAEAASATLETSLAFARGGSGIGGGGLGERSNSIRDPRARFPATTGGHALASHWISKERSLFLSAPLLAKRLLLRRELGGAPKQEEKKTSENERALSSVALSSLSMLLWRGGDKLLPGLLGFGVHASLARDVEAAAAVAAGGEVRGGESALSGFRAIAARASWSLGAALCSCGRWQEARDPLLRALRDSSAGGLPESGENGRHRIVSWIARVEYKVKGDLGSAADFYARAAARASSSNGNSSSSSSSSSLPLEASAAPASSPASPPDPLALEQEAEALEGAAGLLRSRGNDADALACYRASLAARSAAAAAAAAAAADPRSPPSSSPSLPALLSLSAASAANNAAVLLVAAGARAAALGDAEAAARRYREAERLYAQVLASRASLLGPEDPAVAAALFNGAALAARRGLRREAREGLQRAAAIREYALGARSAELAEVNAALALWTVSVSSAAGVDRGSKGKAAPSSSSRSSSPSSSSSSSSRSSSSSLCLSRREARAHARAALSVFEELAQGGEAASEAVRARHAARVAQLQGFLLEN